MELSKRLYAEFFGTMILVFAGTGAIITEQLTGAVTHAGIALTFGAVVMALIYTLGHISGAHFNPAVTIAFSVAGEFDKKEVLPYSLAQVGGGIAASALLYALFAEDITAMASVGYLGATLPRGSWMQSFGFEFVLTFILMLVIFGSAVHAKAVKKAAGLAIGATVGLEAMFAGPICGASMNPARSIGPALISGHFEHLWLYIVATVLGAVAAVFAYRLMR
ncbi:MAG: MIP family channel protein [Campylobacterota bacterium]|nr:MIP family channel protein [Campylobacterota bacterium]